MGPVPAKILWRFVKTEITKTEAQKQNRPGKGHRPDW
ncbi:hypothetical protein SMB34_17995 [Thalassospira permensis NBRC 106175]|uniref:Transposase n=1 Tax=Thalassospira permensis NBRC 106175 TaxID=1353532 RepID=A0ABR4TND5_9PROT|nr:hypothetical protein SMB34_17995 [Thalassospira permensis NBRC 106175]